jgi:two-component sensor histidine kinase/HAMP domain-containing protein
MILFVKLKHKSNELINNTLSKGVLLKIAVLSWVLIIITLLIFILGIIPAQREVMEERMKSEAKDIANSVGQVAAPAIISKDYGFIVDFCSQIIKQSNSILYIIITKKDGFSLIQTANGSSKKIIKGDPNLPNSDKSTALFIYSPLVKQKVFHYSYLFKYSGNDWGRINIGLSIDSFNQNMGNLYHRIIWLAVLSIFVAFVVSVYFANKLTSPIRQLESVAKKISDGELGVRVNIESEDEIGRLVYSFNKMADSLKSSQDNLERKVEKRTAELENTNKVLQVQVKEKMQAENALTQYNIRLEALDKIYRGIISAKSVEDITKEVLNHLKKLFASNSKSSIALFDEPNNTAIIFNREFENDDLDPISKVEIPLKENFDLEWEKEIHLVDCKNNLVDNAFYNEIYFGGGIKACLSVPLLVDGQLIGTITVSSRKADSFNEEHKEILSVVANQLAIAIYHALLQVKIKEHAKNLQNSLSEKEILLKEIHHRIKNNLQVISSLLYLNSKKIKDKEALDMFKDSQNKIKSIALIHERLYQSKSLGKINFNDYVKSLMVDLFRSYGINQEIIKLNVNINDINISIDSAVPCGLIINELVSNSLKHAFPEMEKQGNDYIINIDFNKSSNNELLLVVGDNGIGIGPDISEKKENSLGIQLVETLVDQLEGTMEIDLSSGTVYRIRFEEIIV